MAASGGRWVAGGFQISSGGRSAYNAGNATFGKQITYSGNKHIAVKGPQGDCLDLELRRLNGQDTWTLFRRSQIEALATGMTLRDAKRGINNMLSNAYVENGRIYAARGTEIGAVNS